VAVGFEEEDVGGEVSKVIENDKSKKRLMLSMLSIIRILKMKMNLEFKKAESSNLFMKMFKKLFPNFECLILTHL
jgi:hypothetical protein